MPSPNAWESYHTPHCSADKWKQWFWSPKLPEFRHFLAKFRPILWSGSQFVIWKCTLEALKPYLGSFFWKWSGWLPQVVVWTRDTLDIDTESQVIAQIYHVIHSGFVSQKLLQVAVNCIYRTSDPPRMFANGVWTWMMLLWGSLIANGTLDTSFGSRNTNFCFLSALFWDNLGKYIMLVDNELSTKKNLSRCSQQNVYKYEEYRRARSRGPRLRSSLRGIAGSVAPKTLTKDPSSVPGAVAKAIGGCVQLILLGQHQGRLQSRWCARLDNVLASDNQV